MSILRNVHAALSNSGIECHYKDMTSHNNRLSFVLAGKPASNPMLRFMSHYLHVPFSVPFQHYLEKYKYIGQEAADPNMKVAEISEGPKLHEAIRAFQRMAGLPQTGRAQISKFDQNPYTI